MDYEKMRERSDDIMAKEMMNEKDLPLCPTCRQSDQVLIVHPGLEAQFFCIRCDGGFCQPW